MRRILLLLVASLVIVAGCTALPTTAPEYQAFLHAVERVNPVATKQCRKRDAKRNCNFHFTIDQSISAPANAFQGVEEDGRPVIVFTANMLKTFRNEDELAFVMSHEVAHHILQHRERQKRNALAAGKALAQEVSSKGGSEAQMEAAEYVGAVIGAKSYSKDFELEADELGARIAHQAGYRPSLGIAYFEQIPDPGDVFLGSHPANPRRIERIKRTIRRYGLN